MSFDPSLDTSLGTTLQSLLEVHGLPLLSQPERLAAALASYHPQWQREIALLVQALQQGVPQALLQPVGDESALSRTMRLAQALSQSLTVPPEAAQWAIQSWKQGLGLAQGAALAARNLPPALQVVAERPAAAAVPLLASPVRRRPPVALLAGGGAALAAAAVGSWFVFLQSSVEITGVHTAQPMFIADGKPQPVKVSFKAKNAEIRSIESRYLRGGGQWNAAVQTLPVDSHGERSGELDAGMLSQRVQAPASATFEYVLVTQDGQRSRPFLQTFNLVPPVTITSARLSGTPRLRQPFAVQLAYRKGAGDIVQVTRRVVESSVPWAQQEQTMPVSLTQDASTYEFAMEPPSQPMRSTVEFEMVDSLGVRSEPVRVAVNVDVQPMTQGPATVLSVVLISGGGAANGIGAVTGAAAGGALGNQIGRGSGRTAATVLGIFGGAIAGHQVEQRVRGPSVWETTVRFDDGNTRRVRHADAPRWAAGQRVVVTSAGAITL